MGDIVLMTPALSALRRGAPGTAIHVLLTEPLAPLLTNHPHVDALLTLGPGLAAKIAAARRLRQERYDAVLDFHGGPTSAWLTLASGAPLRIGLDSYRFARVYGRLARSADADGNVASPRHTVRVQASLVEALGCPVSDLRLHLEVDPQARRRLGVRLAEHDLPGSGYVLVQPTASFPTKTWPPERFREAAIRLGERTGLDVVVSLPEGSPDSMRNHFVGLPVFSVPLSELVALTERAALYLGNDAGPMHLAAALGVPVVGLFGSSDPRRWFPWDVPHRVLWAGLPCSPCHGKWCSNPKRLACLDALAVSPVVESAVELLNEVGINRASFSADLPFRSRATLAACGPRRTAPHL